MDSQSPTSPKEAPSLGEAARQPSADLVPARPPTDLGRVDQPADLGPASLPVATTANAHRTLRTHLPQRDWRWLGLRLSCRHCGQRWPCPPRRVALRHLEPGA